MRADVALRILDWIWMDDWRREAELPLLNLSVTQHATLSLLDGIEPTRWEDYGEKLQLHAIQFSKIR